MSKLVEPLRTICLSKVKNNAVKQENEKLDELKRSAMRAYLALIAIPDAGQYRNHSFACVCCQTNSYFC